MRSPLSKLAKSILVQTQLFPFAHSLVINLVAIQFWQSKPAKTLKLPMKNGKHLQNMLSQEEIDNQNPLSHSQWCEGPFLAAPNENCPPCLEA